MPRITLMVVSKKRVKTVLAINAHPAKKVKRAFFVSVSAEYVLFSFIKIEFWSCICAN